MKNLPVGTGAILNRRLFPFLRLEFGSSPNSKMLRSKCPIAARACLALGREWKSAKFVEVSLSSATFY